MRVSSATRNVVIALVVGVGFLVALGLATGPPRREVVLARAGVSRDQDSKLIYQSLNDLEADERNIAAAAKVKIIDPGTKKGPSPMEQVGLPSKADLGSGRKFYVEPYTLARVLRQKGKYLYIEILGGNSMGKTGWIDQKFTR